jgi:hypothetical protein
MKKKLLLTLLVLALTVEIVLTILCFFKPKAALGLFGMEYNALTAFLGYIIAWFCLLVSGLIVYAVFLLKNNQPGYRVIIYMLGFWWIGLGIGVYITFNKTDNLLLDSLKGLLLVTLNYLYAKEKTLM